MQQFVVPVTLESKSDFFHSYIRKTNTIVPLVLIFLNIMTFKLSFLLKILEENKLRKV